ncbi:MAG: alginate export family protein, partial [Holophagales bacterium]|nr:alginate export family protein [Holophagales bacterium]
MIRPELNTCYALILLAATLLPPAPALAEEGEAAEPDTFVEALTGGETTITLRYRFEYVDDDAFGDTAEASTLRTTLAYRTAAFHGWSLFVEAEDVTGIPDDDGYNNAGAGSRNNGVRGVPVVADPEITELNQAYLRYRQGTFTGTLGRQAINLGDQRFVGAVAWRQNHQSFDAARFQVRFGDEDRGLDLDYAYLDQVHRIFGDRPALEGHALRLPFDAWPGAKVTPYGLWIDYEVPTFFSTATYGLELKGKRKVSDRFTLGYELEAAQQDDYGDNPTTVDARYLLGSVSFGTPKLGVDVTWELLGGEPGEGRFTTPLATLHKWNGWADKFLVTPATGLETLYLRLRGKLGERVSWMVIWHDFRSDSF